MPLSPDKLNIDHVQIAMPAGQEEAARAFFVDIIGMSEEPKPPPLSSRGGCWFRRGDCKVHLGVEDGFQPQKKAHPAFVIDDLDALAMRLDQAGHPVLWDDAIQEIRRFYSSDPFGNRIEFLERPLR